MTFELFAGIRSVGTVTWEREGWIRLRIRDPAARGLFLEHLGGPAAQRESEIVRFRREDLSPAAFEEECTAIATVGGYQLAPRPHPAA